MLTPLTPRQQTLIVNNVLKAVKNIELLNKTGYNFLYLASGFIAHYNLYGFKDYYSRHDLAKDIIRNYKNNQWTNFRPGDNGYEYYMSKAETYHKIYTAIFPEEND